MNVVYMLYMNNVVWVVMLYAINNFIIPLSMSQPLMFPRRKIREYREVGKTQFFVNICTSWREVKIPYESTIVELPRNIFCIPWKRTYFLECSLKKKNVSFPYKLLYTFWSFYLFICARICCQMLWRNFASHLLYNS